MIATSELRDAVEAIAVIQRYSLRAKLRGSQYRLRECPRCKASSHREAIAIDARNGSWLHHGYERAAGGECSGDVLDLIAACEGLDCRRDFRRIVEIASEIAGIVGESDSDREARAARARVRAQAEEAANKAQHSIWRSTAGGAWNALRRRDLIGEKYLATRGLDAEQLLAIDAVRFANDGVAVAIRDADGYPVNVARRLYHPSPPTHAKVMTMRDHSTRGTMINAACDIMHGRGVIVVEGVIDALTARLAWPKAVILGANGAGNIPKIIESIAGRLKLAGCHLAFVPHDDEPGVRAVIRGGEIAIAAGVEPWIFDCRSKDLNEAWGLGWRP